VLGPRSTPIVTVTVAAAVVLVACGSPTDLLPPPGLLALSVRPIIRTRRAAKCAEGQRHVHPAPMDSNTLSESRHDSDTHNYPVRRPVIRGAGLLRSRYRAASAWTSESAAVSASASAVTAYISQRMPSASSAQNLSALA